MSPAKKSFWLSPRRKSVETNTRVKAARSLRLHQIPSPLAGEGGELQACASNEPGEGEFIACKPLTRPLVRVPSPARGEGKQRRRILRSPKPQRGRQGRGACHRAGHLRNDGSQAQIPDRPNVNILNAEIVTTPDQRCSVARCTASGEQRLNAARRNSTVKRHR